MKTIIVIENGKVTVEVEQDEIINVEVPSPRIDKKELILVPETDGRELLVKSTISEKPITSKPQLPSNKMAKRNCIICGNEYQPRSALQKCCSPECVKEKDRRYQREHYKKPQPKHESKINDAQKRWGQAAISPVKSEQPKPLTPDFKPKESVPMRPPEEKVPGATEVKSMMDKQRAAFEDPWDCEMCRNAGDLCLMHENMESQGKRPPMYKPSIDGNTGERGHKIG